MKLVATQNHHVFVTGVTGFVGKVVLEEIIRRREELGVAGVSVLIRGGKKGQSASERFRSEVAASPCFAKLPSGWEGFVRVVEGELTKPLCGVSDQDAFWMLREVTHIINCAASIEFTLPVQEAARSNIQSALNVLDFAKKCTALEMMVNVSTAYVSPWQSDATPIHEELVKLPRPASEMYRDILDARIPEADLLKETGHPNTYTLTKCLAEHLLNENRGDVPLAFVRPSIVSACWKHPFRGWIDSRAALGAYVMSIGSGVFRILIAKKKAHLDVVPCDVVSDRILAAAFDSTLKGQKQIPILYAVAGMKNACELGFTGKKIVGYFRRHPIFRKPGIRYSGEAGVLAKVMEFLFHRTPGTIIGYLNGFLGAAKKRDAAFRLRDQLLFINREFRYFTHNTFDFRASRQIEDPNFTPDQYLEVVCEGIRHYVFRQNDSERIFAGAKHARTESDISWMLTRKGQNATVRIAAYLARKVMRKAVESATFDKASFEEARKQASPEDLIILVPTHRSYCDFVLCSYLCLAHPELNISVPRIAAAEEFSRIPVMGKLLTQMHAFYVKRGLGRENPELTRKVHEVVERGETLEFFIEGMRSRSRRFLSPRRGLLKCLQGTGRRCHILPISISYDAIPEEEAFLKELRGEPKPRMRLNVFIKWVLRMLNGKVKLGRIHLSCGTPILLSPQDDIHAVSRRVMAELQSGTTVSTYALRCFVAKNSHLEIDVEWLKNQIRLRGGRVLESRLDGENERHELLERCLRYQWMHHFYDDARALYPEHPVINHHIRMHGFVPMKRHTLDRNDEKIRRLVAALFKPVCESYSQIHRVLLNKDMPPERLTIREMSRRFAMGHGPDWEDALEDLVERQILSPLNGTTGYSYGPKAAELQEYASWCRAPLLPEDVSGLRVATPGLRRVL